MKNLLIAVAIIIATILTSIACTNKTESKILNAFADQEKGVPEWIEIDWSNETKTTEAHQITYGLGGRTCHSIVEFNLDGHMEEHARRCDY